MPLAWKTAPFDEFLVLRRGKDLTKSQFQPGDIPVAGSNGVIGYHNKANVAAPGVTVGRSGSVGKVSVYRRPFWAHNTCLYVRDFRGNDELFSYFFLQYLNVGRFKSGASVPTLDRNSFRFLPVTVPPLAEQRQIARILSAVQRATERQERLIALTAELKKALMHRLFTEGTCCGPLKQTEIGPVPEGWTVGRLDTFCVLQRGFDITKDEQTDGTVPVVSSGGIKSYHNVAKVKGPGVVVGRKGTLGTVHYVEGPYWPHDTTLWVKDFRGNDPRFASYFLDRLDFARFDSGASNPTLNRNTVHGETVAYPPLDQQIEIGASLAAVEAKREIHERMARSLQSLFRTLLHQIMTAQVRVSDLDLSALDELPAEVREVN